LNDKSVAVIIKIKIIFVRFQINLISLGFVPTRLLIIILKISLKLSDKFRIVNAADEFEVLDLESSPITNAFH
jgi:hypothetical protein